MYPTLESRTDILRMLDEAAESRKKILDYCGRLTPAQLNDPVYPGTWSVLQNLAHLAWAEAWMLAWIEKRPGSLAPGEGPGQSWPGWQASPGTAAELASITLALDEAHAAALAFLQAHPEAVLKEKCQYSRKGEQTVGALTARAGVSQPAVSKHLGVLKQAGLVRDRHEGRQTHYSAQLGALAPLIDWTSQMASFWQSRFDDLEDLLKRMDQ